MQIINNRPNNILKSYFEKIYLVDKTKMNLLTGLLSFIFILKIFNIDINQELKNVLDRFVNFNIWFFKMN